MEHKRGLNSAEQGAHFPMLHSLSQQWRQKVCLTNHQSQEKLRVKFPRLGWDPLKVGNGHG